MSTTERSVFILAPCGKDAALIQATLERACVDVVPCADADDVGQRAAAGMGALLVAEEALQPPTALALVRRIVESQPTWSDLPVLLLAAPHGAHASAADALAQQLGNVTTLHRPTQTATLVSMVRTALRTRDRQYEEREAAARKDMFLAALAHELRNPLAPLSNALHLLHSLGVPDPRQQWALGVMQRQTGQLCRLVDDLLDVARITRGKISLQRGRMDLRDAVNAAIETSLPLIEAMEHRLDIHLPGVPVWVNADATRMAQCVSNLLGNAAKYTPRGGFIEVALRETAGTAELSVRDTGIGFKAHEAARLFEVFAQIERATPQAQGGLGLGLSIVKALVEMHGGTVRARSEGEGHGSVFLMHLPCVEAAPTLPTHVGSTPPGAAAARCLRVLVVDDNEDSADSMSSVLAGVGHEARTAYNGQSALALASQWRPEVALLDIGLPDMTGHELARALRSRLEGHALTLVALTGWGQATDVARSLEAGFDHHLTKPADIGTLLDLLDSLT